MYAHPLKEFLGKIFNTSTEMRKSFYSLLDIFLLRSWHLHRELRKWKKTAPSNAHILEIGSGFGQNIYFLSKIGRTWNIVGIDVNEDQISDCNRFFHGNRKMNTIFKKGSVEELTTENAYDLILTVDLMEHVENDELAFANIYRALKTSGSYIITTPVNRDVYLYKSIKRFRKGYELKEIKEKLKTAGFHHIKFHYSYALSGIIALNLSLKWPLYLTNFSSFFIILLIPYYILVMPLVLILNYIDTYKPHRKGAGLIIKATK